MDNYYYIVAGLPVISHDWKPGDVTPESIREEIIGQCSSRDRKTIELLLEGFVEENLTAEFYRKALSCKNRFIREYFLLDLNVRNAKVRYLNEGTDILERERGIDDLMWARIEEMTISDYFDLEAVLGFLARLHIVERWYRLDDKTGREMFRRLVDEVRGTFKGVRFDAK